MLRLAELVPQGQVEEEGTILMDALAYTSVEMLVYMELSIGFRVLGSRYYNLQICMVRNGIFLEQ